MFESNRLIRMEELSLWNRVLSRHPDTAPDVTANRLQCAYGSTDLKIKFK